MKSTVFHGMAAHARHFKNPQKWTDWAKIWCVAYFKVKSAWKTIAASYDQSLF